MNQENRLLGDDARVVSVTATIKPQPDDTHYQTTVLSPYRVTVDSEKLYGCFNLQEDKKTNKQTEDISIRGFL